MKRETGVGKREREIMVEMGGEREENKKKNFSMKNKEKVLSSGDWITKMIESFRKTQPSGIENTDMSVNNFREPKR